MCELLISIESVDLMCYNPMCSKLHTSDNTCIIRIPYSRTGKVTSEASYDYPYFICPFILLLSYDLYTIKCILYLLHTQRLVFIWRINYCHCHNSWLQLLTHHIFHVKYLYSIYNDDKIATVQIDIHI